MSKDFQTGCKEMGIGLIEMVDFIQMLWGEALRCLSDLPRRGVLPLFVLAHDMAM